MSERASIRGSSVRGSRGGRGDANRGGRGGAGGGGAAAAAGGHSQSTERPRKESILDLSKYSDKRITVKFNGGREVTGVLKGFDQLMNLVLDEVEEILRDDVGNQSTRPLGLVVARGTLLTSISPVDGAEVISNPFVSDEESDAA